MVLERTPIATFSFTGGQGCSASLTVLKVMLSWEHQHVGSKLPHFFAAVKMRIVTGFAHIWASPKNFCQAECSFP